MLVREATTVYTILLIPECLIIGQAFYSKRPPHPGHRRRREIIIGLRHPRACLQLRPDNVQSVIQIGHHLRSRDGGGGNRQIRDLFEGTTAVAIIGIRGHHRRRNFRGATQTLSDTDQAIFPIIVIERDFRETGGNDLSLRDSVAVGIITKRSGVGREKLVRFIVLIADYLRPWGRPVVLVSRNRPSKRFLFWPYGSLLHRRSSQCRWLGQLCWH